MKLSSTGEPVNLKGKYQILQNANLYARPRRVTPHVARPRTTQSALILESYDTLQINALTLGNVLKHTHGLNLPHKSICALYSEKKRKNIAVLLEDLLFILRPVQMHEP